MGDKIPAREMEYRLAAAIESIIWKLDRKEIDSGGQCIWAKIDGNDAIIREARRELAAFHDQA